MRCNKLCRKATGVTAYLEQGTSGTLVKALVDQQTAPHMVQASWGTALALEQRT